jgi:hypothetical protein
MAHQENFRCSSCPNFDTFPFWTYNEVDYNDIELLIMMNAARKAGRIHIHVTGQSAKVGRLVPRSGNQRNWQLQDSVNRKANCERQMKIALADNMRLHRDATAITLHGEYVLVVNNFSEQRNLFGHNDRFCYLVTLDLQSTPT